MQGYTYTALALAEPESREHFASTMEAVCEQAGAQRYLVVRLDGQDLAGVLRVVHNGGPAAEDRLGERLHWSVGRMLDLMRRGGPPKIFGSAPNPGIEVDGFAHGIAAVTRMIDGGCVVYFGLDREIKIQEAVQQLMPAAQLAAQMSYSGLSGKSRQSCPLSPQELASVLHFSAANSAKGAARTLGISVNTVRVHLSHARIRCGVDTTLAVSVLALENGWISLAEIQAIKNAA